MATSVFALAVVPYWTAFIYHIFLGNEIGMLATSMPGLMSFAKANAISPLPLGLIWAFAAGGKIFVYQSGVLVTGYSYGYFKARCFSHRSLCHSNRVVGALDHRAFLLAASGNPLIAGKCSFVRRLE